MAVARALVAGGMSDDELRAAAALGFRPEDYEDDVVEVWPCCMATVLLFDAMSTQWRVGPSGVVGLDYGVLDLVVRRRGFQFDDEQQMFVDLQIMENGALLALHERRKQVH
jgi:hypothetical protein